MEIFILGNRRRQHGTHATVEHVEAKAHGGRNSWTNLIAACQSCNSERGTDNPQKFWFAKRTSSGARQ